MEWFPTPPPSRVQNSPRDRLSTGSSAYICVQNRSDRAHFGLDVQSSEESSPRVYFKHRPPYGTSAEKSHVEPGCLGMAQISLTQSSRSPVAGMAETDSCHWPQPMMKSHRRSRKARSRPLQPHKDITPRSVRLARAGLHTPEQIIRCMTVLLADVVAERVSFKTANLICKQAERVGKKRR